MDSLGSSVSVEGGCLTCVHMEQSGPVCKRGMVACLEERNLEKNKINKYQVPLTGLVVKELVATHKKRITAYAGRRERES